MAHSGSSSNKINFTVKITKIAEGASKHDLDLFIKQHSADHGLVNATLFNGYALINYSSEDACEQASSILNGSQLNGVTVQAKIKGVVPKVESVTVKINRLPTTVTEKELMDTCLQFGDVNNVKINTGFAYVNFFAKDSAEKAVADFNDGRVRLSGQIVTANLKPQVGNKTSEQNVKDPAAHKTKPTTLYCPPTATKQHDSRSQSKVTSASTSIKVELDRPGLSGQDLSHYFGQFGEVKSIPKIHPGTPDYAFINFSSHEEAAKACERKAVNLKGVSLSIKLNEKPIPQQHKPMDTQSFSSDDSLVNKLIAGPCFCEIEAKLVTFDDLHIKPSVDQKSINIIGSEESVSHAMSILKSEAALLQSKFATKSEKFHCSVIPLFSNSMLLESIQKEHCVEMCILRNDGSEEKPDLFCASVSGIMKESAPPMKVEPFENYLMPETISTRDDNSIHADKKLTIQCKGFRNSINDSFVKLRAEIDSKISYTMDIEVKDETENMAFKMACDYCIVAQKMPGKIALKGEKVYVNKVMMSLKAKISAIRESLAPAEAIGPYWDQQNSETELKNVDRNSKEWNDIEKQFKTTVPNANFIKIQRIQNKWLWERYAFCRGRMQKKNGTNGVNEKRLFHGTRGTKPELVYQHTEHGFDFRFGQHGVWGKGAYFACDAKYSNNYAYSGNQTDKQMFMAYVLTGDSINIPNGDSSLDKPPIKEQSGLERYDSVNGHQGPTKIYIVYDHDKSYPAYLITYQV